MLRTLANHLFSLLVPPSCPACHTPLASTGSTAFCPRCYAGLPWWDKTRTIPPTLPPGLSGLHAPLLYEGPARDIILQFKFANQPHLARPLARLMLPHLPAFSTERPPLLVPVPVHPGRLRQRLYNQSALLTKEIARLSGLPAAMTGLTRLVPSDGQATRTRAQRLKLPGHHFRANPHVRGRHIILIDDIYTTGATARACALALKRGGALSTTVLTLAYTPAG